MHCLIAKRNEENFEEEEDEILIEEEKLKVSLDSILMTGST
jgi:hypothetical protein